MGVNEETISPTTLKEKSLKPRRPAYIHHMSTYIRTHWVTHLRVSHIFEYVQYWIKEGERLLKWYEEVSECFHYVMDGSGRV
jgi:hypothetical protein